MKNPTSQLRERSKVGTDWEKLLEETPKISVPTFLIKEVHFIMPGHPDVVMPFDALDPDTLELMGREIQELQDGSRIRLVIDLVKYQSCIEQVVNNILNPIIP